MFSFAASHHSKVAVSTSRKSNRAVKNKETISSSSTNIICSALFPSSSSSQKILLSSYLNQRVRNRTLLLNSITSSSSNCSLYFTHLVAPFCAIDPNLSRQLQLMLLADNVSNNNSSSSSILENDDADFDADENDMLMMSQRDRSSPATSMLLLDLEVPSVVASASSSLQTVASQLLDYHRNNSSASCASKNSRNDEKENYNIDSDDDDGKFIALLTSIVSGRHNHHLADTCTSSTTWRMIPSHLYPSLLSFSDPAQCKSFIENDVEARLSAIRRTSSSLSFDPEEDERNQNQNDDNDKNKILSMISEDEKNLMKKISEQSSLLRKPKGVSDTSLLIRKNHQKAPIDPVVFLKLFGSILRNPSFSREDTFIGGHESLLLLASSYSAQLPPSDSFSPTSSSSSSGSSSSSSSFHGTVRNVVTLLLIRLSRLYGRPARALEFSALHRCLREHVPWMISMAPMLYWTWLLGSTVDAVMKPAAGGGDPLTAAAAAASSILGGNNNNNSSSSSSNSNSNNSSSTMTTLSSSLIVQRLDLSESSSSSLRGGSDLEALARLWSAFVPSLQEAVTIATSRLLDESSRKIRTTCIKVALFLDEYDRVVSNRCEEARRLGVPFTFQRLLQVYNTWGYHTVFFPNTSVIANNNNNNNNSSEPSSWSIDPKDATSQVIRLFGVALRRGCLDLMIKYPAEFERPLLDFIEQINVDRPFALLDSTSHILSILSELYTSPLCVKNNNNNKEEEIVVQQSSDNNNITKQKEKEEEELRAFRRAGITKVATRIWEWLRAVIKSSGRGGWDPQTISPIANSLETLEVIPKSPFWWQCGCGARNPSASIRCTMCLRRSASASCHWTCASERCRARQFIDSSASPADSVRRKCVACGSKHPWLGTLEKMSKSISSSSSSNANNNNNNKENHPVLLAACSKCLQVQHVDVSPSAPHQQQIYGMIFNSEDRVPLIDLCGIGVCSTFLKQFKNNNNTTTSTATTRDTQEKKNKNKKNSSISTSSATSSTFVENAFMSNNTSTSNALDDITMTVNNKSSVNVQKNSNGNNNNQQPSTSSSSSISWTCHECSTESTTPACPTCGLPRDDRVNMWNCDECGSWNFGDFARCRRGCATKKRSTQRPVPYVRWKCGCGATNPMWRLSCGRCCPRDFSSTAKNKQQSKNEMYTCPSCNKKPSQTRHRRIRDHLYRPGFTINSCSECGADHPRDIAVARGVNFERPCVSCGDWHTLPGLVVSSSVSSNNNNIIRTSSRTTCCSHCGCETDASAEPFTKWNCETCSYEEDKKTKKNSNNNNNITSTDDQKSTSWRTGYRCNVCGDLHPSLAFSVIRNGIAARLPNGDPHDAVFLWKCQGTDVDDPDSCCGQFNSSWETKCSKCGQIRYVPPPMMTRTSPCHGGVVVAGSNNKNTNNSLSSRSMMIGDQYSVDETDGMKKSIKQQKENEETTTNNNNQHEIRARYIPWSCESCHTLCAPEDVLFCPKCSSPRTPPPCNVCGGNHISLYCAPSTTSTTTSMMMKMSSSSSPSSSSSLLFGNYYEE